MRSFLYFDEKDGTQVRIIPRKERWRFTWRFGLPFMLTLVGLFIVACIVIAGSLCWFAIKHLILSTSAN